MSDVIDKQEVKSLLYWLSDQLDEIYTKVDCEDGVGVFNPKAAISGRIYRLQKTLYNNKLREHLLKEVNND